MVSSSERKQALTELLFGLLAAPAAFAVANGFKLSQVRRLLEGACLKELERRDASHGTLARNAELIDVAPATIRKIRRRLEDFGLRPDQTGLERTLEQLISDSGTISLIRVMQLNQDLNVGELLGAIDSLVAAGRVRRSANDDLTFVLDVDPGVRADAQAQIDALREAAEGLVGAAQDLIHAPADAPFSFVRNLRYRATPGVRDRLLENWRQLVTAAIADEDASDEDTADAVHVTFSLCRESTLQHAVQARLDEVDALRDASRRRNN